MTLPHAQKWVDAEPQARDSRVLLAKVQIRLAARLGREPGHNEEGEELARKALASYDQLGTEFPEEYEFAYFAAECADELALLEIRRQQFAKAEDLCRQALARSRQLLGWPKHLRTADDYARAEYRHGLGQMYLAVVLQRLGRSKEATESFELAVPLLDKATQNPAVAYLRFVLRDCHKKYGLFQIQSRRMDEAERQFRRVVELSDTAASRNELAWGLAAHPDPQVQHDGARLAVTFAEQAVELAPKNGSFFNTLGVAHYRAGDWKAVVTGLEKSMELRKDGDSFDWFFLAMAHWKLGDKDKAREWYNRAVQWMDKNKPKNEELLRFRAEAEELLGVEKKQD
jgi:tetratricopeptide (TPR) repeat protein